MEKCEVIQDLIPLYYDGVASDSSRVLVDEHIKTCIVCQEILANVKDKSKIANVGIDSIEMNVLKAIKRKILKKIVVVSFAAVVCTVFILWVVLFWRVSISFNTSNIDINTQQFFYDSELTEPFYGAVTIDVRNNYLDAHFMQINDVLYFHVTSTIYTRLFGGRFRSGWMGINTGFQPTIRSIDLKNGFHRYEITLDHFNTAYRVENIGDDELFIAITHERYSEWGNPVSINRIYYLRGNFNRLWTNEDAFERAMRNAVLLWER